MLEWRVYKNIKKYTKVQMEIFIEETYKLGFEDGLKVNLDADFKIKLIQVLQNTKGVGDKTIEKVLETLKSLDNSEEKIDI